MPVSARFASLLLGVAVAGCGDGDLSSARQASLSADTPRGRAANASCDLQAGYAQLKATAFEKAVAIHPRNASVLDALAANTVVRVDRPLADGGDDALNVTFCKARLVVDLPPGATDAFSGDRQLIAEVAYRTQATVDGRVRVDLLGGMDPIAFRLAAVGLTSGSGTVQQAAVSPAGGERLATVAMTSGSGRVDSAPARVALASGAARPIARVPVRASFNCRNARTRAQQIVCADGYLASLDRETRFLYNRASASADRKERAKLQETRARFLARRERCKRWACIEDVYEDRIKQIERIARD